MKNQLYSGKCSALTAAISSALALAFGIWILTSGLGDLPYGPDELIQQAVSESLEKGQGAILPSGATYKRGRDISELARIARWFIEDPETAGRAPAAAFGVINLVLFGYIGFAIGGPWGGFCAILIMAIFPTSITESRRFRFYSEHLTLMLIALLAVWRTVGLAGTNLGGKTRPVATWIWAGIAFAALALGFRVQVTTVSIIATVSLIVVLAAWLDMQRGGISVLRISVPIQVSVIMIAVGLFMLVFNFDFLVGLWSKAFTVPFWAFGEPADVRAYYWGFSSAFPLLLSLYPLALLTVAVNNWRLALFLGLWFTVPVLMFSFVLPFKSMRYLLGAAPAFLLVGSIAAVHGAGKLRKYTHVFFTKRGVTRPIANTLAVACVALVAITIVVTTPAFNDARKVPSTSGAKLASVHTSEDWPRLSKILRDLDRHKKSPIGTIDGLAAQFYLGRADFVFQQDDLFMSASWAAARTNSEPPSITEFDDRLAQGLPDYYSGLPVLTRPEAIRDYFKEEDAILLIVDDTRWASKTQINEDLKVLVSEVGVELCRGRCGSLKLYMLPLKS